MFTQLRMFNIHRIEKVVGPVFGPILDQNRTFSRWSRGCSREVLGAWKGLTVRFPGCFGTLFSTFSEVVREGLPVIFRGSWKVFEQF